MTTFQTPAPAQPKQTDPRIAQQSGDLEQARQSEQQGRDARESADRDQSGQSANSFTVSTDDWF